MAKKLVHKYTFIPSTNTIILNGMYNLNRFLLISNATTNETLYTFNDTINGMSAHSIDTDAQTTTAVLDINCSGMDATDQLQIFIEDDQTTFRPEEAFVDPVHKFRVSNPENLIDTDFEYGVQSSKWETLELSNNVPSFFGKNSDYTLLGISIVRTRAGSDIIRVTVTEPHRISKGTPIDVQGLNSLTAEGKYLVGDVESDFVFTYQARGVQQVSENVITPYTTIIPGTFYTGADVNFTTEAGIQTDTELKSKLTVTTPSAHGFKTGAKFYFLNTVSPKTIIIDQSGATIADDNNPVVDFVDTATTTFSPDLTKTDTKALKGAYELRFRESAVSVADNTITWNAHGFRENDCVMYVKPAGDDRIGGLDSLEIYYITSPTTNTFRLKLLSNSAALTLTSTGTYNYGEGVFMIAYEIQRSQASSQTAFHYTYGHIGGAASNLSGWDLRTSGLGKMGSAPQYMIPYHRGKGGLNSSFKNTTPRFWTFSSAGLWGASTTGNMTRDNNVTYPSSFNFIEDFTRFDNVTLFNAPANSNYYTYPTAYLSQRNNRNVTSWSGTVWNYIRGELFLVPANINTEADSLYYPNHGLTNGQSINFSASGTPLYYYTMTAGNYTSAFTPSTLSSGTYLVEKVDNDRFRLKSGTTTIRIASAKGTYTLSGLTTRPTSNTFYVGNHGFAENNLVTAGVEFGARLPSAATGPITYESSDLNLQAFKGVCDDGLQAFVNSLSSKADMIMDGTTRASPFLYGSGDVTNTSMAGGFSLNFTGYDSTYGAWSRSAADWSSGLYDTGEVEDMARSLPVAGSGHSIIMTPYIKDSSIPFWSAAHKTPLNRTAYSNLWTSFVIRAVYTTSVRNHGTTNPTAWTTVGVNGTTGGVSTDWRFARTASYTNINGRDMIIQVQYVVSKDSWDSINFLPQNFTSRANPAYSYFTTNTTNQMKYTLMFRLPDAITADATLFNNLDAFIMDTLVEKYAFPALSISEDYFVSVVNDNRFRLKSSTGLEVNITDSGISGPSGDTAFTVTNNGSADYVIDSELDPVLYLKRGYTYTFSVSAVGHPFWIQTTDGAYDAASVLGTGDGITNNGTQNGIVTWTIPADFMSGTYYYVCQNHSDMFGSIVVDDSASQITFLDITNQIGVLDGVYTATKIPTDTSIEFQTNFNAGKKQLTVAQSIQTINDVLYFDEGHRLQNGTPVVYISNNNAVYDGFIDFSTYIVTILDDDYLQLSDSLENFRDGVFMPINWSTIPSSTHILESTTVNGLVPISPTITVTAGSKIIDGGEDSIFLTYYKAGDEIIIKDPSTVPGTLLRYIISSVVDDSIVNLVDNATFTSSTAVHLVPTKIYTRPDGATTHRPFDGGVEIIAGSAPGSQIVRQTRKYFRYQSGKGIQISLAINFNPPALVQNITAITDVKCERDIEYIADGARLDTVLNTTYHAYFSGLAELRSLYLNPTVSLRIGKLKNDILALPNVDSSVTAEQRVTAYFTELLQIIEGSPSDADSPTYTNPTTGRTAAQTAAKDQLIANLTFILDEVDAFNTVTYPNTVYNTNRLFQDIEILVYALAHDLCYGGNFATYQVATVLMYPTNTRVYGTNPTESLAIIARLKDIVGDVIQEATVTASAGNTTPQDISGTAAGAGEKTVIDQLIDIVTTAITYGLSATEFTDITKTYPSITWAATELQDAVNDISSNINTLKISYAVQIQTKYPHTLSAGQIINVSDCAASIYNGNATVTTIIDEFNFLYSLPDTPTTFNPNGIVQFRPKSWVNSSLRCGLYDFQNGFFYEFDGQKLYAVRRSSTVQLSGTAQAIYNSNEITGVSTNFNGQLSVGELIVLRGQSYKVTSINSNTNLTIQPKFKGVSTSSMIITKTEDLRVPQDEWNLDVCDGNGPSNFNLDLTKIQMAYMDYSWYGAGKIRFGFKDTYGHVLYTHEMTHNNRLTEAYMRSGNLPARYEIENYESPTYQPKLFHWGTSVIMDGTFDDDKAYLFTAASNTLSFTNGQRLTATTNTGSNLTSQFNFSTRTRDWYLELQFPQADATKFSVGTTLYTADFRLDGRLVDSTYFRGTNVRVRIYIASQQNQPSNVPVIAASTAVSIGAPPVGGEDTTLLSDIPMISIRLAPSVDNGITGNVGERDIINRMQLQLKQVGLVLTHDCEVSLILNSSLSNVNFAKVQTPSLSNLVVHDKGDTITGGTPIFKFRASGGTDSGTRRLSSATDFDLSEITDLGNSILGGDGVFPNGPDLLTIAIKVIDTSDISAASPFECGARVTWSESQA